MCSFIPDSAACTAFLTAFMIARGVERPCPRADDGHAVQKAGIEAESVPDSKLVDDRQALIDELKKEREDAARAAVVAAQEAEAEAWLAARREEGTSE